MAVKPMVLDFTNVKEGGGKFNRAHRVPGDYLAKVTNVEGVKVKGGENKGQPMWLFTIKQGSASYPYYCQFTENTLWKLRTLFAAAGINVPSKRVKMNPTRIVGKEIGISLDDHEYEGKLMSEIIAIFPTSELPGRDTDEDEDEDEENEDEDTEDEDEDEDETDEEGEEEEDEGDDEDEDEEEPPPPPKKKSKKTKAATKTRRKKQDVADEELEELDIEDI